MLRPTMFHRALDLASEAEFQLGEVHVDPARLTVSRDGRSVSVEPRVMMVIVVLAQAGGRVVSRNELVERCWDGRVVGDNAVQRVISRIRHVAATLGGFDIETIPKVGYSVRPIARTPIDGAAAHHAPANDAAANEAAVNEAAANAAAANEPTASARTATDGALDAGPSPRSAGSERPARILSRRWLIGGLGAGAVLAVGAAGFTTWRRVVSGETDGALARRLIDKAREAALGTGREANAQAIAYLRRATELDPSSAEAWGELALAYRDRMDHSDDPDLRALAEWTRAAAARALAIDPDRSTAKIALATIQPNFRHWAANERVLRELHASVPPHPAMETALGWLLCDVGRWTEAIPRFQKALAFEPFHPDNQLVLGWALWGGGRLDEVDRLLENALRLWPQDRWIWQSRFEFLVLTGRTAPALALLDDESAQPVISPDQQPVPRAALRDVARAIQSGAPADVDRAAEQVIASRPSLGTYSVVPLLCALGRLDDAFAMLERYFFGSAPGPLSRRKTAILFLARTAPLRGDPRFGDLTRRLGLDDYWRETGTGPDAGLLDARPT